jgi:hypothetical protein
MSPQMLWEVFKANSKFRANGSVLLLAEESLLFLAQHMVVVLLHVPCHVPQLLGNRCEPALAHEATVLEAMLVILLLGPSTCPTASECCLSTHLVLKIQHLPWITISKLKVTARLVSLPWHQAAAGGVGNVWVGAIVPHPRAESTH